MVQGNGEGAHVSHLDLDDECGTSGKELLKTYVRMKQDGVGPKLVGDSSPITKMEKVTTPRSWTCHIFTKFQIPYFIDKENFNLPNHFLYSQSSHHGAAKPIRICDLSFVFYAR